MAAKNLIVKCSVVVIVSLIFSVAIAQDYDTDQRQMLFGLFETALVNDNYALWKLQQIFFNPDSKQSPEQVCLMVSVKVDTIEYPDNVCDHRNGPAFIGVPAGSDWYYEFDSYYELQQQVADDASDTSELAKLITKSGSTSVFYSFDPSFYSIMKALSSSIALIFPYNYHYDFADPYYYSDYTSIAITINTKLVEMPCWDNAVYALRSVLMWVSFNYQQK